MEQGNVEETSTGADTKWTIDSRTKFSDSVRANYPTYSPRPEQPIKSDKLNKHALDSYLKKHPELPLLVACIESEIIQHKPENILDFLTDVLFHDEEVLRQMISNES
jgi:hypothetical protein